MMAQSRAESTRDTYNYGQYLNQFPPNTIKVIREFERIQKRICRHKMSIMFNEICINEEMLPKYTYIYIYNYHQGMLITWITFTLTVCPHQSSLLESSQDSIQCLNRNNECKVLLVRKHWYVHVQMSVGECCN